MSRERSPEEEATRRALQRLVQYPEFEVFVKYFKDRIDRLSVDPQAPNVSALLIIEGRRLLHREISDLPKRVSDERSGNSGDG